MFEKFPETIPLSVPTASRAARRSMKKAVKLHAFAGQGQFSIGAERALSQRCGSENVDLTSSGSIALLVALLALGVTRGDKVLVPSFSFVAVPQAVLLTGASPVFVDIDPATLCLDPLSIQQIDDPAVKALVVIHYGGIAADMKKLMEISRDRGWRVLEDAAHSLGGMHQMGPLGSIGDVGVFSFDHQKNIQVGEAGAVVTGDDELRTPIKDAIALGVNAADRRADPSLEWDWKSIGTKAYPPDYIGALLSGQLESFEKIHEQRKKVWLGYRDALMSWSKNNKVRLPEVPSYSVTPTWHIFWCGFSSPVAAESFIDHMRQRKILVALHYSSLARTTMGRNHESYKLEISDWAEKCVVRLPLGLHVSRRVQQRVIAACLDWGAPKIR